MVAAPVEYKVLDVEETLKTLPLGDKIKMLGGKVRDRLSHVLHELHS